LDAAFVVSALPVALGVTMAAAGMYDAAVHYTTLACVATVLIAPVLAAFVAWAAQDDEPDE
jgi:multisubunit Na+/H+ antiporter MnhG subunit